MACGAAAILSLSEQLLPGRFANLAIVVFAVLVVAGVRYLGYVEFRVASQLTAKRVLFRMIDAEMKLQQLEAQLKLATDEHDAISLIRTACQEIGVENTFIVREGDEIQEILYTLPGSQVNLPIDSERTLILHGLPSTGQPLPIERLSVLVRGYFQQPAEARTAAEAILNYRYRGLRPVA